MARAAPPQGPAPNPAPSPRRASTPTSPELAPHPRQRRATSAYAPCRPQPSPLYQVLSGHFESLERVLAERDQVEVVSDRSEGPYAGVHRFSTLEFIARWLDHVPERYKVRVRYSRAYATRPRVWWWPPV